MLMMWVALPLLDHVHHEKMIRLIGQAIFFSWNEYCILGEIVNHNHKSLAPLNLGQTYDKVYRDVLPWMLRSWEWFKESHGANFALTCLVGTQDMYSRTFQCCPVSKARNICPSRVPMCVEPLSVPPTLSCGTCVELPFGDCRSIDI